MQISLSIEPPLYRGPTVRNLRSTPVIAFATSYGPVLSAGLEGTGSYGAELARVMARAGFQVIEVNRPNRQARRLHGKSDPLDAYQAAEAVLAKRGTSIPKTRDGYVEALRVIQAGRNSALKARTALICQIKSILITATEGLRAKYRPLSTTALIKALAASRPVGLEADPVTATAATLKKLAQRHHHLTVEIIDSDARLKRIIAAHAPGLTAITGVGTIVATQLLVTMGDNPDRCTSEAQFAALTGTAPIPASSGKTIRHRLSRGGDRAANAAIHHIALVRMSTDQRTRAYVIKRTAEGKSKREILRCLKRYIAREIYRTLRNPTPVPLTNDLRPRRLAQQITLTAAAQHFGLWASAISRIEQGKCRDHDLTKARHHGWASFVMSHDHGGATNTNPASQSRTSHPKTYSLCQAVLSIGIAVGS